MSRGRRGPAPRGAPPAAARGAALLLAMIVLTLVATVAAGMVWQQQRAIHIEGAERARTQAHWMLDAMVDFGRYALRVRTGSGGSTAGGNETPSKGAPWDLEIQESSIASLLAADRDNNADTTLEAYIAGFVEDAQSRYNLANVVNADGTPVDTEVPVLARLCAAAGAPGLAPAIVAALSAARKTPTAGPQLDSVPATTPVITRVEHLRWLGVDEPTLARLMQLVDLLPPGKSPPRINLNTASAEVIEAVLGDTYGSGIGQRLTRVNLPKTSRFDSMDAAQALAGPPPEGAEPLATRFDISSSHFYLMASVRFEDRALAVRALVEREGTGRSAPVHIRRQERGALPPGVTLTRGSWVGFGPGAPGLGSTGPMASPGAR